MKINDFIINLSNIGININQTQLDLLEKYYNILIEWNEKINLTGITEKEEVYLKHFYDSATLNMIVDLSKVNSLCDIGTGAGFPGIVIKILFPNIKITLVDSLNKRVTFLNYVIEQLNLKDIEVILARAEEYSKINRNMFDIVTARAVATLPILLEYSIPLVKINGYFIAMKSDITEELKNINACEQKLFIRRDTIKEFYLPVENSKRTLIKYNKISETPLIYPRKYNEIKKHHL